MRYARKYTAKASYLPSCLGAVVNYPTSSNINVTSSVVRWIGGPTPAFPPINFNNVAYIGYSFCPGAKCISLHV